MPAGHLVYLGLKLKYKADLGGSVKIESYMHYYNTFIIVFEPTLPDTEKFLNPTHILKMFFTSDYAWHLVYLLRKSLN